MEHALGRASRSRGAGASRSARPRDFLYLGRGINYPIALEGALKLKEISYIHAEGYPAGEMKHGPIALIDETLPVVALCPQGRDLREDALERPGGEGARRTRDRGRLGQGDTAARRRSSSRSTTCCSRCPRCDELWSPLLTVLPLQLLAYHVAVRAGRDVDQPRNLAKSVTVE